ncbi:YihY/virulence factor BrkB family protein [Capnocytophaga canimorsus]|uniref:YihY/virulence factor BrkB family protein n=1 Tax=Capnocytophaga canimorsus TaxID=28188 RepID=UPI00385842CE
MIPKLEKKLQSIPVLGRLVSFLKKIRLGKHPFSLYDLIELYVVGIAEGAVTYRASAISYSFFVAIFPFLLFVLNLIPYVPIEDFQQDFWIFLDGLLPPGTNEFFADIFFDIANKRRAGLLSSVFLLSIFLMTNGVVAIFGGFEYSYHVKNPRNMFRQYFVALGVTIILALLLLFVVILFLAYGVYVVPYMEKTGIFRSSESLLWWSKVGAVFLISYFATSFLYYFGTKDGKKNRFFSVGSLFTTLLFGLTTYLFGLYIENFSQYNQLYGSIGALLIFLFYTWLNSNILLLGFELNATLLRLKKTS